MANNVYVRTFLAKGKWETSEIRAGFEEGISDDDFVALVEMTEKRVDIARQVDPVSRDSGGGNYSGDSSYRDDLPPEPEGKANSLGTIEYLEDDGFGWCKVPFDIKDSFKEMRLSFDKKELAVKWVGDEKLWQVGSGWFPPKGKEYSLKPLGAGTLNLFLDKMRKAGFTPALVRGF